jgi:hypothetical protein
MSTVRAAMRMGARAMMMMVVVVMVAGVRMYTWTIMMALLPKDRILTYQERLLQYVCRMSTYIGARLGDGR